MKSWIERYQGETRNTIDYLRYHRLDDPVRSKSLLQELLKTGTENQDNALLGFAHFYLAQLSYLCDLQFTASLKEAKLAIGYLENADAPYTQANCYDLLATLYLRNDMYQVAAGYLLKGISLSEEIGFSFEQANMISILSDLYLAVGASGKAEELLQVSTQVFEQAKEDPLCMIEDISMRILNNRITRFICRLSDGIPDDAEEEIEEIRTGIDSLNSPDFCMPLYCNLRFLYDCRAGKEEAASEDLKNLIVSLRKIDDYADIQYSLISTMKQIYESGKSNWIMEAEPIFQLLMTGDPAYSQKMKLIIAKWECIRTVHPEEAAGLMDQMAELSKKNEAQKQEWNLKEIEETVQVQEAEKKADEWMDKAIHDELTGLPNRRSFIETFHVQIPEVIRKGDPFAIGLVDADHFKEYNDHYGHVAGDQALREIGDLLAPYQSSRMVAARYGGDELCFAAFGMSREELEKFLEEFYQKLYEIHLMHAFGGKDGHFSISCGIAFYLKADHLPDLEKCLEDADQVLYRVKRADPGTYEIAQCTVKTR
ncbi:MAG: GGDEF domain-containing protein [Bulleidia sp.]